MYSKHRLFSCCVDELVGFLSLLLRDFLEIEVDHGWQDFGDNKAIVWKRRNGIQIKAESCEFCAALEWLKRLKSSDVVVGEHECV